jgi:hypothetical protein
MTTIWERESVQHVDELERQAWIMGDTEKAGMLACISDGLEQEEQRDNLQAKIDNILELITEANWRTGKKAELIELIKAIKETAESDE